ncbi:putative acyl esterase [Gordonia terrae C-6]|uniref:Putative acyl esterase n=1 Tax=Gordonia terrae C-6 TaxID=1316928 RepID=R7Y670_9ACTN|nr:CocE/NonD family hydrolase [Gordonia terrae]EON31507.1 putative acyl esterase [Gordonia terrae C-6]
MVPTPPFLHHTPSDAAALDRPWRRPGAARYALTRIRGALRPPVEVYTPDPDSMVIERDSEVLTRDGTVLRVNVHRPVGDGPFPVILSAHPYGKDNLPTPKRFGKGYTLPFQYRALRQTAPVRFSSLTSWESPDPAFWTAQGYVVVNADLRGCGHSDGIGSPFAGQEGEDVHDLVEWAAVQPWSTGRVAMLGVSYLAITQWEAAATRPPHLVAIVPWEGFTDAYRDLMCPGGIRETGFIKMWSRGVKTNRLAYDISTETAEHPLRDDYWRSLVPDLAAIEVPALVCGSFSDNNLHSRGSMRGFEKISSIEKHLYTHRGGKWATFYSAEAQRAQIDFLARHLREDPTAPQLPAVRLEVRESRDAVVDVRDESRWPPASTQWTSLFVGSEGLTSDEPDAGSISFDPAKTAVRFGITFGADTEICGPAALRLFVSVTDADDVDLFVGLEKWRGTEYVPFEGSYGFGRDRITTGWMRASLRELDPALSTPHAPVPTYERRQPLEPGEIVQVAVPLGPSATAFRHGEQLRLVIAGRWLWPRNPLIGNAPAAYESGSRGRATVHWGPDAPSRLLVPVTRG